MIQKLARTLALLALAPLCARAADNTDKPWSVRMADSIMTRQAPKPRLIENPTNKSPSWSYSTALAVYAVAKVGIQTGDDKYLQYARDYADEFVDANGNIDPAKYKPDTFKLDDLAPGRLLMLLSAQKRPETGAKDAQNGPNSDENGTKPYEKYSNAVQELLKQVPNQPRNKDGGFWHKKVYPHQMWLDGIFMGCPLMAEGGNAFHQPKLIDEACTQIQLIAEHTRDPKTGLFFHGYDDSREQKWADKTTGLSPNLWGRADGWYAAGIVDSLDNVPPENPSRQKLITILLPHAAAIAAGSGIPTRTSGGRFSTSQNAKAITWNPPPAACSFMRSPRPPEIITSTRVMSMSPGPASTEFRSSSSRIDDKELVTLKDTCLVAGLGGTPYRDGSYNYYIHEKRGSNDPKGMGPFILASLELEKH